jgi:hypothetical protein
MDTPVELLPMAVYFPPLTNNMSPAESLLKAYCQEANGWVIVPGLLLLPVGAT